MAAVRTVFLPTTLISLSDRQSAAQGQLKTCKLGYSLAPPCLRSFPCSKKPLAPLPLRLSGASARRQHPVLACLPPPPPSSSSSSGTSTRLYVSGLSFRTTEQSLRNAFESFGHLVEVNLVMDKIANRPRGFAFLRYATEEESRNAIEGMHGKFLDGRVIFVEIAKPRSESRKNPKHNQRRY